MVKKRKFLQIDYKQKYPFTTLLLDAMPYLFIAFIIIAGIVKYYPQKEKFNPETSVCLKTCYIEERGCYEAYKTKDFNEMGCKEWRPKTQCELGNESWIKIKYNQSNCYNSENGWFKCNLNEIVCREKTQQELNQDYCDSNPYNSEKCECLESKKAWKFNPYSTDYRLENYWYGFIERENNNKQELLNKLNLQECIYYENKTRFFINEKSETIKLIEQEKIEKDCNCYYDYGDRVYLHDCYYDAEFTEQNICLKAIPKINASEYIWSMNLIVKPSNNSNGRIMNPPLYVPKEN